MSTEAPHRREPPPAPLEAIFSKIDEHERNDELDAAESLLQRSFGDDPEHPHAIHLRGVLAYRRGRKEEARACMERSRRLAPEVALYSRNLCELYRALGDYDRAVAAGQQAILLAPKDSLARLNLAVAQYDSGEIAEAMECARTALELAPGLPAAHFELAKSLLVSGDFAQGWEEYEWRYRIAGVSALMPETEAPQWDGLPLTTGTLLLIADQGFGDVFQFCRYIPWVVARCADVVVACAPELYSVISRIPGPRAVNTRWNDAGKFTCYAPLSGLPRLHGTRLETIPASVPYLHADAAKVAHWRRRLNVLVPGGYRRVAMAWAGRPTHKNDAQRSATLASFAPLATLEKTALISLQKGAASKEVGTFFGPAPLINLGPELGDFEDTMAVLDCVDLLTTVDTAVGHLAGALGRPVWLGLAYATDWRWLLQREDSPWYPHHRLCRQTAPGAWNGVFKRIAADVEKAVPIRSTGSDARRSEGADAAAADADVVAAVDGHAAAGMDGAVLADAATAAAGSTPLPHSQL